jgi:3-hydroxybutyryl-CoA dehydrogenase
MTMGYKIVSAGESRSFPQPHAFLAAADPGAAARVYVGADAGHAFAKEGGADVPFIAIELGQECLGVHTGEQSGSEGSNVVGFARFRLGDAQPSNLIELVRQAATRPHAVAQAKAAFEAAGFTVAVCEDFPGRIVDRLIRPYYNAALRRLDEKLATAEDLDMTLRLGLGYPEGPIALLTRTGLHHHFQVTTALYQALAEQPYAPARRACVAHQRFSEDHS